jgi:hypothetical protein
MHRSATNRLAVTAWTALALACGDDAPTSASSGGGTAPSCDRPYLGEASAEPMLELLYFGADELEHPLEDGAEVDLVLPPQGGRVLFLGVRATNVDPCEAVLTGAMRDPETKQVRFDTRTINLDDQGDGWGKSASADLASYANVPACHNTWTQLDVFGSPFTLELTLKDRAGKQASRTITAIPRCAEPDNEAECRCICHGGYVLGESCSEGGGSEGGGSQGGGAGGGG